MNKISINRSFFTGKRVLWLIALGLILIGVILIALNFLGTRETGFERSASPVIVEPASPYLFADVIEAIGTARANESVVLTAQISDTVKGVHFRDGALVEEGEILVTLQNAEEQANVSAALANYTEARQQYDRTKPLVDKGTVSQAALDAATRALNEAEARLNAARARAGDYVITAPFSGVLGLREVSPGTLVSPGTEITTLDDISVIKLDFSVPEKFLSAIEVGQEIIGHAAAFPREEFRGIVRTVGTRINPVTRAVTVRAEIPNEDFKLRPGMLLTVNLISNIRESLSVPETAIIPIGETQFVFRVSEDNIANRVQVEADRRYNNRVEILSGLSEGDPIVVSGVVRLRPGSAVRIQNTRTPPGLPEDLMEMISEQTSMDVTGVEENEAGETAEEPQ